MTRQEALDLAAKRGHDLGDPFDLALLDGVAVGQFCSRCGFLLATFREQAWGRSLENDCRQDVAA